jgi:hypothetical protein
MMALVGVSISGMPGPPLGPSYLITMTAPCKLGAKHDSLTPHRRAEGAHLVLHPMAGPAGLTKRWTTGRSSTGTA